MMKRSAIKEKEMDFSGKIALVTGSSGGAGKGIALALAKEGCDLVLVARNLPKLAEVKQEIESLGRRAVVIQCDTSQDEEVVKMGHMALKACGQVDILINNAAAAIRGRLEDTSMADWDFILNTNLKGYIRVIQAFLTHFMSRKNGYIVNVSSIQALGFTPALNNIPYIVSKAGIIGLSDCLFSYLGPLGIKVSCLVPGGIDTDMPSNARFVGSPEMVKVMRTADQEFIKKATDPRGPRRFLTPDELAAGLLAGMRKEDYIISVPDYRPMLKAQGRDIDVLNAFLKQMIQSKK
jgi:NAD(P)-dependent dehydrogenase (short-subunit alcohol dehydrogenase family)